MRLLDKIISKLNEFGLGKFDYNEIGDRIIFTFEGQEICIYDKKRGMAFIGLKPPLTMDPMSYFLTSLLCCAITVKLFGNISSETSYFWVGLYQAIIYPISDGKPMGKYVIIVPAINLDTDVESYKIEVAFNVGQNVSLQIHPKDLPNNDKIQLIAAAMTI